MISEDNRKYYFAVVVDRIATAKNMTKDNAHSWVKGYLMIASVNSLTDSEFETTFKGFREQMSKDGIYIPARGEPDYAEDFDDQSDGCFSPEPSNMPDGFEGIDQ